MQQYDGQPVPFPSRLWDSFYRHRYLFLMSVSIVIVVTVAALKLRKPTYTAAAQTEVVTDNQELASVLGSQDQGVSWISASQKNVNEFQDLLGDDRPDGFVDTALKAAQLNHPINVDPRANDARYAALRKRLSVTMDSDNLFSVSLTWDDPLECERIVSAFQAQFIDEVSSHRQASAVATTKFLDSEIASYESRMRLAEQALIDYKEHNSGQLPEAQTADIQQLAALKNQRDTLLISSQDSALKRAALEARITQVQPMSVSAQTMADGPTRLAIRQLMAKRASLIADGYLETSDTVSNVDAEIGTLEREAQEEDKHTGLKGQVVLQTSLQDNPEYAVLNEQLTNAKIAESTQLAEMRQVDQQIADYEARISKIPAAQRELNDKTRDYTILKAQYESLKERREQAQLKAQLDRVTAQSTLVPVGTIYAIPTTPKSKTMIMAVGGVFVGLIIGIALVIFSEWTDPTIRYGSDVERILEVPLLAETPELTGLPDGAGRRGLRDVR